MMRNYLHEVNVLILKRLWESDFAHSSGFRLVKRPSSGYLGRYTFIALYAERIYSFSHFFLLMLPMSCPTSDRKRSRKKPKMYREG